MSMKIAVGSTNPVKIRAVEHIVAWYKMFEGRKFLGSKVSSNVSPQPASLSETIDGAQNRAKAAYVGHDLGIGIESGFMNVREARGGVMNTCVAVIYDGNTCPHRDFPAFEYPPKVLDLMVRETHRT